MNATDRINDKGLTFGIGQTVTVQIPWSGASLVRVLEDGDYVILDAETLDVADVADNWESAETYALDVSNGHGYVVVLVDEEEDEGFVIFQNIRNEVTDCWGLPY